MLRATHAPLPLDQLLDLYAADRQLKPIEVRAAILQGARSEGVGFYFDPPVYGSQALCAAALLYPLNDATYELVFACRPETSRHILQIVRTARLTAVGLPQDVTVRARCRRDNVAGRRLAWMCGLRPAGIAGDWKLYELRHGEIRGRHQDAVHRRRHVGARRRG